MSKYILKNTICTIPSVFGCWGVCLELISLPPVTGSDLQEWRLCADLCLLHSRYSLLRDSLRRAHSSVSLMTAVTQRPIISIHDDRPHWSSIWCYCVCVWASRPYCYLYAIIGFIIILKWLLLLILFFYFV